MDSPASFIIQVAFMGIGATIVFDLWGQFLKYAFKITPFQYLFSRALDFVYAAGNIPAFQYHYSAKEKGRVRCEGWAAHYMIGITLAEIFAVIAGAGWFEVPSIIPAVLFGIATVAAPLFIVQPAFGFGFAASKSPNPWQARLRSVMNHAAFGVGLFLFALLVKLF